MRIVLILLVLLLWGCSDDEDCGDCPAQVTWYGGTADCVDDLTDLIVSPCCCEEGRNIGDRGTPTSP